MLLTILGGQRPTAEFPLAGIGTDLTPFPTAEHLASRAGFCAGNNQSAGKRPTGRMRTVGLQTAA